MTVSNRLGSLQTNLAHVGEVVILLGAGLPAPPEAGPKVSRLPAHHRIPRMSYEFIEPASPANAAGPDPAGATLFTALDRSGGPCREPPSVGPAGRAGRLPDPTRSARPGQDRAVQAGRRDGGKR